MKRWFLRRPLSPLAPPLAPPLRPARRAAARAMSSTASSSSFSEPLLPVEVHSSAFWSDPAAHRAEVPKLAVLVLNAPPGGPGRAHELFWSLWRGAQLTVCADGGANRLLDRSRAAGAPGADAAVPRFIKGDLDSLRADVRAFYEQRGAVVVRDPSQDTNDLDKCLQLIHEEQEREQQGRYAVLILGAMGGRFDQEMQNVNALFRWAARFEQLVLLSEDTSARLLLPGRQHVIRPNLRFETRTCGLIPVAGACASVTTSGLQWDLHGDEMRFGGLISSSNRVVGGQDASEDENRGDGDGGGDEGGDAEVTVRCSHPLVWTTELRA